jgi:protein TonB
VEIARGVDPSLDKEALRVVKNMPKWKPGKQRGKAVRVSYTVPINFVLQ